EKKDAAIAKHWAERDNAKNIEKLRSMQQGDNKKQIKDNKENTKREVMHEVENKGQMRIRPR
ncbi:28175_t:CDS:1, partial [Gigaspora margarita]